MIKDDLTTKVTQAKTCILNKEERSLVIEYLKKDTPEPVYKVHETENGIYGTCPNCNLEVPVSDYCRHCGKRLEWR